MTTGHSLLNMLHTAHCSVLSIRVHVDQLIADAQFKKFQKQKYVEIIKESIKKLGNQKIFKLEKKKSGLEKPVFQISLN